MTIQEFKQQYGGLSFDRLAKLVRTSADFRGELRRIYEGIFHDNLNHKCINCWWDAYHVLMTTNTEKLIKMNEKNFDLRAGAVLIDVVNHDTKLTATRKNLTDDLALYHLRTHPEYISDFSKFPANWRELAIESSPVVQEQKRKAEADALKAEEERLQKEADEKAKRTERARKAAQARAAKRTESAK